MIRWLIYLKLELRKGMALIPFFLVSALLAGGALFLAAFLFCAATDEKQLFPKAEVAVVMGSDGSDDTSEESGKVDLKTGMAIGLVESMSSVKSICNFRYCSPKEAAEGLEDGSISAAIYLPDDTFENINSGINTPVLFRLSGAQGARSGDLFRQLVTDGVSFLRTIETVIYAVDRQSAQNPPVTTLEEAEDNLFGVFLKNVLGRGSVFAEEGVSAFGSLSMNGFYTVSVFVLLLMLFGIGCASFYSEGEREMLRSLKRLRVPRIASGAAKWLSLTVVFFILTVCLSFVVCFVRGLSPEQTVPGALREAGSGLPGALPYLAGLSFSAAAFVHLVYTFVSKRKAALIYLLLSAALFCFSGGLLPLTWMPEAVRGALACMPVPVWQSAAASVLYPSAQVPGILPGLSVTASAFAAGALMLLPAWIREIVYD